MNRKQTLRHDLWAICLGILLVAASFTSCAKYKVAISALNQVNEECADSIIYNTIPAPDISSGIIQISLNQFVKANEGYRSWAVSINKKAIELVDDPAMTPAKFAAEIIAATMLINEYWGSELVRLVEPVFDAFKVTNSRMNDCDREFIRRFCTQRLDWWGNFKTGGLANDLRIAFLSGTLSQEDQCWLAKGMLDVLYMQELAQQESPNRTETLRFLEQYRNGLRSSDSRAGMTICALGGGTGCRL